MTENSNFPFKSKTVRWCEYVTTCPLNGTCHFTTLPDLFCVQLWLLAGRKKKKRKKKKKEDLRLRKNYSFDSRAQVVSGENRGFWRWRYISSRVSEKLCVDPLWTPVIPSSFKAAAETGEPSIINSTAPTPFDNLQCPVTFDTNTHTHSRTSTILFSISVVTPRLLLIPHTEACQITAPPSHLFSK